MQSVYMVHSYEVTQTVRLPHKLRLIVTTKVEVDAGKGNNRRSHTSRMPATDRVHPLVAAVKYTLTYMFQTDLTGNSSTCQQGDGARVLDFFLCEAVQTPAG